MILKSIFIRNILVVSFAATPIFATAQNKTEWSPSVQLTIEDFQSNASKIDENVEQFIIQPAIRMDFSFQMSSYEFMLTKNFNSKVTTTFNPKASVLAAPDIMFANRLLKYAQLNFNLLELYARKYRKRLYESKGVLSEASFFQKAYDGLEEEYNERQALLNQTANMGQNEEIVIEANNEVLQEILELEDFCKTCKPEKKRH
ncbi:hypothetical protein LAG90_09220 [Marinilongibacter aquaticus]|uniref:hypothetical protein n=1 Tax=Marinilongibacter aquaticus TaxID=2975157 RepID=UPI0021BD3703|nr:hypothetical protein [Marinilongibacter aquaticus]UBM60815.1 hypothetical protein LAG90_09220 [Marinilongibacter aquaticus]